MDESNLLNVLGDAYTLLATSEQTNDAYLTVHARVQPGNGPPPHIHTRQEESFYVIEGEMTFWLDGQPLKAGPGRFVRIPPGRPHTFKNESDSDVVMLFSLVPCGRMDQFFRAIAEPLAPGETPSPPTPEVIARVLEQAPRYGIEILAG